MSAELLESLIACLRDIHEGSPEDLAKVGVFLTRVRSVSWSAAVASLLPVPTSTGDLHLEPAASYHAQDDVPVHSLDPAVFAGRATGTTDSGLGAELDRLFRDVTSLQHGTASTPLELEPLTIVASERPLAVGDYLEHYEILDILGSGVTHSVYLAQDRYSCLKSRRIALHVFDGRRPDDTSWKTAVSRLAHVWIETRRPGILHLEDLKELGGRLVYVTDFIDGRSLRPKIRPETLVEILLSICEDFAVARSKGVTVEPSIRRNRLQPVLTPSGLGGDEPVRDAGAFLLRLLADVEPADIDLAHADLARAPLWLVELIERCLATEPRRFRDMNDLLEYVRFHTRPDQASRIELTATRGNGVVDYELKLADKSAPPGMSRDPAPFKGTADNALLEDLTRKWRELEQHSLARLSQMFEGVGTKGIDDVIRRGIKDLSVVAASSILGRDLRRLLARRLPSTLTLVQDPALANLPWELFDIGGRKLGLSHAITRVLRLHTPPEPSRRFVGSDLGHLKVVLLADQGQADCRQEIETIEKLFLDVGIHPDVAWTSWGQTRLRARIGKCDVLHFAGHGFRRGLLLGRSGVLGSGHLRELWAEGAPVLVFANACDVADVVGMPWPTVTDDSMLDFAQAACGAGVASFIGSPLRPPSFDGTGTVSFAATFYRHLLEGRAVSHAVLEARRHVSEKFGEVDLTWARYVLFGDPFTTLALSAPGLRRGARGILAATETDDE